MYVALDCSGNPPAAVPIEGAKVCMERPMTTDLQHAEHLADQTMAADSRVQRLRAQAQGAGDPDNSEAIELALADRHAARERATRFWQTGLRE